MYKRQELAFVGWHGFLLLDGKGTKYDDIFGGMRRLDVYKRQDEEIYAALDKAHCLELVRSLPQGLDTVIGSKGVYPVSYTHLDVYKRQTVSLRTRM